MNAFLKEASEFDKLSVHSKNDKSRTAEPAHVQNSPSNEEIQTVKIPAPVVVQKPVNEPLGVFNNPDGKPQVVHDDPYLEPFMDDFYLRQKEYKK
jgi:hypothetical protein